MRKTILLLILVSLFLTVGASASVIDSLRITPSLDEQTFRSGHLDVSLVSGRNRVVSCRLLDADGQTVASVQSAKTSKAGRVLLRLDVPDCRRWTAETPYLYTLRVEAANPGTSRNGNASVGREPVDRVERKVGFRMVAIRYAKLYLNGCPLFLKGINLHGMRKGMGRDEMVVILQRLRKHNINAVRTDLADSLWYDLCDEYGFYVCADLADGNDTATVAAAKELYNHPSLVMWSIGGTGDGTGGTVSLRPLYWQLKRDDTQRPVMWVDLPFTDTNCDLYCPSGVTAKVADDFCNLASPVADKPQLLASFGSANGNSYGAIGEYMAMRYVQPKFAGGFLCDGTFLQMLAETPAMADVAYWMQGITTTSHSPRTGRLEIFNDSYFSRLENVEIEWAVRHNGEIVKKGVYDKPLHVEPRKTATVRLGYEDLFKTWPEGELALDVTYRQKTATPLVPEGQTLARTQIVVRPFREMVPSALRPVEMTTALKVKKGNCLAITNSCCDIAFDKTTGWLTRYAVLSHNMLADGGSLRPSFWRDLTDNDIAAGVEKRYGQWRAPSYRLVSLTSSKVKNDSTKLRDVVVTAQYEIEPLNVSLTLRYTITAGGAMKVEQTIAPHDGVKTPVALRYGMTMQMPAEMRQSEYFGRGPLENYPDRKESQFLGNYRSDSVSVASPYGHGQEWGNHCDVRRWTQTDKRVGLEVTSAVPFLASAHLSHGEPQCVNLHIDLHQSGVNESVNKGDYPEMGVDTRVLLFKQTFSFWLTPVGCF